MLPAAAGACLKDEPLRRRCPRMRRVDVLYTQVSASTFSGLAGARRSLGVRSTSHSSTTSACGAVFSRVSMCRHIARPVQTSERCAATPGPSLQHHAHSRRAAPAHRQLPAAGTQLSMDQLRQRSRCVWCPSAAKQTAVDAPATALSPGSAVEVQRAADGPRPDAAAPAISSPCHAGVTSSFRRYLSAVPQQPKRGQLEQQKRQWVPPYERPALGSFANPYIVPSGLPYLSPNITVREMPGWLQGGSTAGSHAPSAGMRWPALPLNAVRPMRARSSPSPQSYLDDSIPLAVCGYMRERMRTFRWGCGT